MALVFAALFCLPTLAAEEKDLSVNTRDQIQILQEEKLARIPIHKKLDSQLVYALRERRLGLAVRGALSLKPALTVEPDGRLLVDIRGRVSPGLLGLIKQNGGIVISSFERYDAIRALVPLTAVETVAAQNEVRFVSPAAKATTNDGSSPEGNIAHRASEARSVFHVDGTGIKVGVLSDSVDYLNSAQSAGRLIDVTILPGQAGAGSGEGTAMLEIVHALSPGSQLYFATAFSGEASFAQNIRDLYAAGCRIIIDDVTYFDESPFQDGVIAQAVNDVCAGGALYFSAAGNSGNQTQNTSGTWEGDFRDGGPATMGRGGRVHDFGGVNYNTVLSGGSFRRIDLFWADPLGQSTNDYDVYVLNSDGAVIRSSTNVQDGNNDPYESIPSLNVGERIVIVKQSGENRFLHLSSFRGVLSVATSGSTRGHNASGANNAFSVAAVRVGVPPQPFVAGETNLVEPFSSDGPRRIFFNPDGSPITPGNFSSSGGRVLQKPDITAADGVTTSVPGFSNFLGTSAAAPHAAAISALLWSYTPFQQSTDIRRLLSDTALDIMAPGFDRNSGAGIAMAYQALAASPRVVIQTAQLLDGNHNGVLDPNECADVVITLQNTAAPGNQGLTGISAVLTTSDPGVRVDPAPRFFPDLPPGGSGTSSVPFRVSTSLLFTHGPGTNYILYLTTTNGFSFALPVQLDSQVPLGPPSTFVSAAVPMSIPDLGIADSTVSTSGIDQPLGRVRVAAHITHTYVSDLRLTLLGPDGTEVVLSANNGDDGQNYGVSCDSMTIFSDEASNDLSSAAAPFAGAFKPDQPLALFKGKTGNAANGTWTLRAADQAGADVGVIQCWSLELTPTALSNGLGQCLFPPQVNVGPTNTAAVSGNTVFLSVNAQGTAPLMYQWYFNETNSLTYATNATLVLSNVTPAAAGSYVVVVANPYGSATSAPAVVTILVPPSILCVSNRTVLLGSSWGFDPPAVNGTAPILSVVSTITNNGCGNNYTVTRTWLVTNETGQAANCGQNVIVIDPQPPKISAQPQPRVLLLGTTASMEVGVSTCPPLDYQWYLNETIVAGATNATLVLSNVTPAQAGSYRVIITNAFGSVTSAPALFTVLVPAFIVSGPTNTLVIEGQTAVFSVTAGGDEPLTFHWFFNETNILTDATNATLILSNATQAQVGSYAVVVANVYSSVTSTPALLSVVVPSFIVSEPTNTVVTNGQNAVFVVTAGGDEPLIYQWYFNKTNTLAEATNATLVLSNVAPAQAGSYSVVVANAHGSVTSTPALLSVLVPAFIVSGPTNSVVTNGQNAALAVIAGGDEPLTFQWYFNETNSLADATNATLILNNAAPTQSGSYAVVVANAYGNVTSAPALLNIVVPPTIACSADRTVQIDSSWDFDTPTITGNNPTLNVLSTVTNDGCGGSYSVTRTWLVTDDTAYQAQCSQTVTVINPAPPTILVEPQPQVVLLGATVSLELVVSNCPPLTYQWYFNETNSLAEATNATLVLSNATPAQAGSYAVVVANSYGSVTSSPTLVSVRIPAFIINEPTNTVATNGQNALFSVTAGGDEPLIYQWYFNATNSLPDETNATLLLSNVALAQVGGYAVVVTNAYGSATSVPAFLNVLFPAFIITQPTNTSIISGQTALFDVIAGGDEPLTFQWYFNETNSLADATNATLILNNATPAQSGSYAVVVANAYGSVTSAPALLNVVVPPTIACSADRTVQIDSSWDFDTPTFTGSDPTLIVLSTVTNDGCGGSYSVTRTWRVTDETAYQAQCSQTVTVINPAPPTILVEPQPQVVLLGATASLEVVVSNCPPLSYQWYFNETNSLAEATNATLVLSNATPSQAGSYAVVVANPYGSVTSSPALVSVRIPAFIINEPTNTVATNGQTALFSVTAGGDEPFFYEWRFDATNAITGATNAVLVLSNVTRGQAGSYTVVVTNAYGSITSTPALLNVVAVPAFIVSGPTNTTVINGETALFSAIAGGDQPLTFRWYFNTNDQIPGASGPNLVLTNVTLQQSGRYSVVVSNAYGSASSQSASLRVLAQARLLSLTRTGSVVNITFSTVSNLLYSVDYKDDLISSNWLALPKKAVLRLGTGEPLTVQDPNATGTERFYRIKVE